MEGDIGDFVAQQPPQTQKRRRIADDFLGLGDGPIPIRFLIIRKFFADEAIAGTIRSEITFWYDRHSRNRIHAVADFSEPDAPQAFAERVRRFERIHFEVAGFFAELAITSSITKDAYALYGAANRERRAKFRCEKSWATATWSAR